MKQGRFPKGWTYWFKFYAEYTCMYSISLGIVPFPHTHTYMHTSHYTNYKIKFFKIDNNKLKLPFP